MNQETEMAENREPKKTKNIAFRVTDEEYAQIERIALAMGGRPKRLVPEHRCHGSS
jgi:hypothetical protein